MNLFVVGWNRPDREHHLAQGALRAMTDTFPLLDPATLGAWQGGRAYAAWLQPREEAWGPRRYVHHDEHELVLWDGTPVDPSGGVAAHDAAALAAHWPDLTGRLEGRFVALRIDGRADTLELIDDPYGTHHTFVHGSGSTWWFSNSARLLARLTQSTTIDLDGMAQCLAMRFPAGTRTLVEGIGVVPAAQHWLLQGDAPLRRTTYAPMSDLATQPKRSFGRREAEALATDMGAALRVLSETYGTLQCPITAGRDSRMMVGLMMAGDLPGDYFSAGERESLDVRIGTAVAQRFGLPHRNSGGSADELAASWDEISLRVVRQHDGTVPLAHARNALIRPERLDDIILQLYGVGGELCRGVRLTERFILRRPSHAQVVTHAQKTFDHGGPMLRPEAHEIVRTTIAERCDALRDEGFAPLELLEALDLAEYGRRWAGAQARQILDHKDVFMPFFTRPFLRAAFATPARERLTERVPYQLLEHLSPDLRALPFEKPLPPQRFAALVLARALGGPVKLAHRVQRRLRRNGPLPAGRGRERLFVLEDQLPTWRERFLDRPDSALWHLVDRERFEHATSDRVDQAQRYGSLGIVYQVVTGFTFEEDLEALAGSRARPLTV
jgi:asparagine synthase (glutamine-hydrolysing)